MKLFFSKRSLSTLTVAPSITGWKNNTAIALMISSLFCLAGCFSHYYKTNTVREADAASLQKLVNKGKYFILHAHNHDYALKQVKVTNDILEAAVTELPPEHLDYLHPRNANKNRFPNRAKNVVLYEV